MTEWQILDSDNFPESQPEEQTGSGSVARWRWLLLVGGIVLFLGAAGALLLRQRQLESQTALREDLTAHIFEEETRRYLGQPGTELMISQVSTSWAEAYQRTFELVQPASPPQVIEVTEIDFDGRCALATVSLEGNRQLRAYCLSEQGWQRAPVAAAAWGQEQPALQLTGGVRLRFYERDQAFAEGLAQELEPFFKKLDELSPAQSRSTEDVSLHPLEIAIEPHDLQDPLILLERRRIVLNSPWLVSARGAEYAGLPGEAAVRLALAKAVLEQAEPAALDPPANLPGAARLAEAVQIVMAVQMVLPPDTQTALLASWRAQLQGKWHSPFFADLVVGGRKAESAPPAEAAARLMADYIYRENGLDSLHQTLRLLPATSSWDNLFQALLNRPTLVLENETARAAGVAMTPDLALNPDKPLLIPNLPLTATLLGLAGRTPTGMRVSVGLPDRTTPVVIELPAGLMFDAPAGAALAPGCVTPGAQLTIDGAWLEEAQRLRATQVTVQQIQPLAVEPAPVDAAAYLLTGPSYDPQALLALSSQSGRLYPLTALSSTLQVFPLPVASAEEEPHFLFRLDLPACNGAWLAHYEPRRGISGQWLAPPNLKQWVWRADKRDIVFLSVRDHSLISQLSVGGSDSFIPKTIKEGLSNAFEFVGWNLKTGQFVFYTFEFNATSAGLFDLEASEPSFQTYPILMRGRRLGPDGDWLAYISSGRRPDVVPDRVEVMQFSTAWAATLFFVRNREGVHPPVWSLNLAKPGLAILAGGVADDQSLPSPTRLLLTRPDKPGRPQVVAQAAADERFASPVFCLDGALLYQAERQGRYRLQRHMAGEPAQTLLMLDEPFFPLACP